MMEVNNQFYDSLGDRWYEDDSHAIALLRRETQVRLEYIKRHVNVPEFKTILDVGCGAGFLANPLAAAGFQVTGIDQSPSSLRVAEQRTPLGAKVSYRRGDAYKLDVSSESFDIVLMLDLLEHLNQPFQALNEGIRVLKPGGRLFFHTFNRTLLASLVAVHGLRFLLKDCPKHVHVSQLFLKPEELESYFKNSGLRMGGLVGIRPKLDLWPLLSSLVTRRLHNQFQFTETKNLWVGYIGWAQK